MKIRGTVAASLREVIDTFILNFDEAMKSLKEGRVTEEKVIQYCIVYWELIARQVDAEVKEEIEFEILKLN